MAEKPSCASCRWRINPNEQTKFLRDNIGTGLCAKGYGPTEVPSVPDSSNKIVQEEKARTCGKYEANLSGARLDVSTIKNADRNAIVMLPNPVLVKSNPSGKMVNSCMTCANLIPAEKSVEEGLWNSPICAAKGVLVAPASAVPTAKNCDYRRMGIRNPDEIKNLTLAPPYSNVMSIGEIITPVVKFEPDEVIEPTTYETDAPVTEEDKTSGIRAWRKIEDEESGNSVLLPIYDPSFFADEERSKIPSTGDDEHPEQYVDHMGLVYKAAVLWRELDETPALWGAAGTGKTEFYRHMAWLMQLPFERISITASTEVEDLAGKMHYEPSRGTYFEYGRIPKAWGKPGVICLDEPNVGPPDVWQFIRPLTDNSKQLVLDMNNGERISRNNDCYLGLAMNPAWDVKNVGAGMIADADGSRLMHIYVELPDEELEKKILLTRCLDDDYDLPADTLAAIMKIAGELRAMCDDGQLPITWGVRPQIKVARATKWFSMSQAYRLATADYLEPEQQQLILDVVKANTPDKKKTKGPFS